MVFTIICVLMFAGFTRISFTALTLIPNRVVSLRNKGLKNQYTFLASSFQDLVNFSEADKQTSRQTRDKP